MKAIKLTDQQQDRLIEMANTLFPGRNWFFWKCGDGTYPQEQMFGHDDYFNTDKGKTYPSNEIHWLEFTIFHLISKLTKTYGLQNKINYRPAIDADRNLIDFIYEDYYSVYNKKEEKLKMRRTR